MKVQRLLAILTAIGFVLLSCGDDDKLTGPSDATPPATVQDLAVNNVSDSSLILTWTAPAMMILSGRQHSMTFGMILFR